MSNARVFALELLNRVDSDQSYLNLILPGYQERVGSKDRGFLQELTYGAIRWRQQYDLIINDLVSNRELDASVRNVLRLGAHQIFRMRVGLHAAVNETVELAKRINPRASGLVNAVMRKLSNVDLDSSVTRLTKNMIPAERLSYEHSIPIWIIGQFAAALKVDFESEVLRRELLSLNAVPVVSLSITSQRTREKLIEMGASPGKHSPTAVLVSGELGGYLAEPGVRVQDEGSQLIAHLTASLTKDGTLLDLCSGPGGKAALIGDLSGEAELICVEPIPARAKLVERALGERKAQIVVDDGTTFKPKAPVDVVLVDAPCSGLGSLRRKPESRWLKHESDIAQLRVLQRKLLENAAAILSSGGHIVYSTCTPVLAETTSVVAEFLERHGNFKLQDATASMLKIAPTLDLPRARKTVQLWTGVHGTDDMFIAILRKD